MIWKTRLARELNCHGFLNPYTTWREVFKTESEYKELCTKEFPEDEKYPQDWWEFHYSHLVGEHDAMDEYDPDDSDNPTLLPYYCDSCYAFSSNDPEVWADHWKGCY